MREKIYDSMEDARKAAIEAPAKYRQQIEVLKNEVFEVNDVTIPFQDDILTKYSFKYRITSVEFKAMISVNFHLYMLCDIEVFDIECDGFDRNDCPVIYITSLNPDYFRLFFSKQFGYIINEDFNNYFKLFHNMGDVRFSSKEVTFVRPTTVSESIIVERSSIDKPTRQIVRDITNLVKTQKYGTHYLPEDINPNEFEYFFENRNVPNVSIIVIFTADLNIDDPYHLNGFIYDDNTIQVDLIINPKHYPTLLYDLIADLNDLIVHEYEHIFQNNGLRPSDEVSPVDVSLELKDIEYYKTPWEVPAEIKGMRRISKLRNQNIEEVIYDWFSRKKNEYGFNEVDIKDMVDLLSSKYKEFYGKN
jgi:hypothetical protein